MQQVLLKPVLYPAISARLILNSGVIKTVSIGIMYGRI